MENWRTPVNVEELQTLIVRLSREPDYEQLISKLPTEISQQVGPIFGALRALVEEHQKSDASKVC